MRLSFPKLIPEATSDERVAVLFNQQQYVIARQTDRNFAILMIVQYVFGVLAAISISPTTWAGEIPGAHVHLWSAVLLGGLITSLPILLAMTYPGHVVTRHVVAVGQMLMGALLIHLTGGRIETHFHVFGSLAFLAFYRDWRVLATGTLVVASDHFLRGWFWPRSVFGTDTVSDFRWLEHVAWVLFEDLFLLISIRQSVRQMWKLAQRQVDLERAKGEVESERDRFFDLSVDMLCVANLDGRFVRVNPMFSRVLGYSEQELLAKPFLTMIHEDDVQPTLEVMQRLQSGVDVVDFENRYKRRDGELRWLSWSCRAPEGNESLMYAVARDVTARREEADALVEARRSAEVAKRTAEEANQAKSEFLANMSHEIRTPLNAVIGMTELVLASELNSVQRDYLQTVLESGESLLTIINEILDFSKIEAGHVQLENERFLLAEVFGDTLRSLAVRAHSKDLELAFRIAPDTPNQLRGDPARLRQVVINLVGNAIKFTEAGEIEVNVEPRRIDDDTVELLVLVRDTGLGISEEHQQQIFEAFTQADMSSTRKFGGTGLGLSICRTLVDLMGGRIWVKSELGSGSTFYFTVKLKRCREGDSSLVSRLADVLDQRRVLIVDDNETNRRILAEMLRNENMITMTADGVASAVEVLEEETRLENEIDLVISDVHMPERDGFDLVRLLRQQERYADTPILLLSSGFQQPHLETCRQFRAARPLMKPVKRTDLLQAVANAIANPSSPEWDDEKMDAASPAEVRSLRILFVEDGMANQLLGRRLLEMGGHHVTVAGNGREAVDLVDRETFDVVLMDVRMPEMDGLEATRRIRMSEAGESRHLPILALTAHALKGDREVCLQAGMDGYVSKPFRQQELLEAIDRAVP